MSTHARPQDAEIGLPAVLALSLILHLLVGLIATLGRASTPDFFGTREPPPELTAVSMVTLPNVAVSNAGGGGGRPASVPTPKTPRAVASVPTPPVVRPVPQVVPRIPRDVASRPAPVANVPPGGPTGPDPGTGANGGPGSGNGTGGGVGDGNGTGTGNGAGSGQGGGGLVQVVWRIEYARGVEMRQRLAELGIQAGMEQIHQIESGQVRSWEDLCRICGADFSALARLPVVPPLCLRADAPPVPVEKARAIPDGLEVQLSATVQPDGRYSIAVVQTSGNVDTDTVANHVALSTVWLPGLHNGVPATETTALLVSFRLAVPPSP